MNRFPIRPWTRSAGNRKCLFVCFLVKTKRRVWFRWTNAICCRSAAIIFLRVFVRAKRVVRSLKWRRTATNSCSSGFCRTKFCRAASNWISRRWRKNFVLVVDRKFFWRWSNRKKTIWWKIGFEIFPWQQFWSIVSALTFWSNVWTVIS